MLRMSETRWDATRRPLGGLVAQEALIREASEGVPFRLMNGFTRKQFTSAQGDAPMRWRTWQNRIRQAKASGELDTLEREVAEARNRVDRIYGRTIEDEALHHLWLRWTTELSEATP